MIFCEVCKHMNEAALYVSVVKRCRLRTNNSIQMKLSGNEWKKILEFLGKYSSFSLNL